MRIGGSDLILRAPAHVPVARLILERVLQLWPEAYFQDAEEDFAAPLNGGESYSRAQDSREFLVYRNRDAVDAWERDGGTAENLNRTLSFMINDSSSPGLQEQEVTMICGEQTEAIRRLVRDLTCSFQSFPALIGNGLGTRQEPVDTRP